MTPRQLLALAVLLTARFDASMLKRSQDELDAAVDDSGRAYWAAYRDEDALRLGARLAVWLEITG